MDGPIVYNARALNACVQGYIEIYNDRGCASAGDDGDLAWDWEAEGHEDGRKSYTQPEVTKTSNETEINYQLFPNPATDKLYILSSVEQEELILEFRDVNNKLLSKSLVYVTDHKADLRLNLINGVYFVTLINKNKTHTVKKVVISK